MATATIQLPDGRTADVDIPEGLSQQDAQAQLQTMFEQGAFDQAPDAQQAPLAGQAPAVGAMAPQEAVQPEEMSGASKAILATPGGAALSEFASGANKAVIDLLDFLGPEQINNILQLAGSEARVPTLGETELAQKAGGGGFVEGKPGEMLRAAGKTLPAAVGIGAGLRELAATIPQVTPSMQTFGAGLTRQLAQGTTAAGDIAAATGAGAGAEALKEFGPAGEIAGGIVGAFTAAGIKAALAKSPAAIDAIKNAFLGAVKESGSEKGAAKLLAEQMVREGASPDDVAAILTKLGPDSIPADALPSFSRILRAASNEVPKIEGRAGTFFRGRQAGQPARLAQAFDEVGGTVGATVDDAIKGLRDKVGPEVDSLYDMARSKSVRLSPTLKNIFDKPGLGQDARKAAEKTLSTRRTLGDKISNIDVIDATKQKLDDQIATAIRSGEKGLVRDLVRVKNVLVKEADRAIPEYKQARDMFAGKAQMESAADIGNSFFKLKADELSGIAASMGAAEKNMLKLGAKNAILSKMDDIQTNADLTKRLFGRHGDIKKLRAVFDNDAALKKFSDVLEREAKFILTRRAAEANSTTVRQAADSESLRNAFNNVVDATSSPTGSIAAIKRIVSGLGKKKTSEEFIRSLTEAGDILIDQNINPAKVAELLRSGNAEAVEKAIRSALKSPLTGRKVIPTAIGATQEGEQ